MLLSTHQPPGTRHKEESPLRRAAEEDRRHPQPQRVPSSSIFLLSHYKSDFFALCQTHPVLNVCLCFVNKTNFYQFRFHTLLNHKDRSRTIVHVITKSTLYIFVVVA